MSPNIDERDATIADLKARLLEAEDTLTAIRQGEVDALIVQTAGSDDEVFMIEGDGQSYRAFMEVMDTGASAIDGAGRVLYANLTLLKLLQRPLDEIQGQSLRDCLGQGNAAKLDELLETSEAAAHPTNLTFTGPDGADLHFLVSATPLRVGTIAGHAVTFADVTERVRAEAAEQSERAARAVIASANEAVLVCDRDGIVTHANGAARIVPLAIRSACALTTPFHWSFRAQPACSRPMTSSRWRFPAIRSRVSRLSLLTHPRSRIT